MQLTVGSLFSGIGGLDLALETHGHKVIWNSEIDTFASEVLAQRWPDVPNLGDITTINWAAIQRPDILAGGFPCQDISHAGKREGINGKRSGLWTEYVRAIRELRPNYVFVENVAALRNRGLDVVLGELSELGFDAEWSTLRASEVGACHRRDRLFIVASHPERVRRQTRA